MINTKVKVGIVGATGLVGQEMLQILSELDLEKKFEAVLFASSDRPSENIFDLNSNIPKLQECVFILNAATNSIAEFLSAQMKQHQCLIDNSSHFRMDPAVPLVVPEINGALLESEPAIVANPNCTAILLCLTLFPFLKPGFSRVIVSTYQAASGAGIKGLEELESQLLAQATKQSIPKPQVFPHVLAGNVISHNTAIRESGRPGQGYNEEEWKVVEESRKILNILHLSVSASCMRVPVMRAHTETVTVDLKEELSLDEIRDRFVKAQGLSVVDNSDLQHFPMPLEASGKNLVLVGRIRKDSTLAKTFHYMLAGDQLRKGAALNAVQIMLEMQRLREIQEN